MSIRVGVGAVVLSLSLSLGLSLGLVSCGGDPEDESAPSTPGPSSAPSTSPAPSQSPSQSPSPAPRVAPDDADIAIVMRAVRHLADDIGPRPGESRAYFRAARWVQGELVGSGWRVRRQRFATPAGVSWGEPVAAGPSVNLIATLGDLRPGQPWLAVGAHLDTVPQAPGAEDNASGVGVLLAIAEALRVRRTRLPVVLITFGSEEPRGPSDDDHHYGSRAYVDSLTPQQRRGLRGMVSLDRVGVGAVLPVGSPDANGNPLQAQLLQAAERAGVATNPDYSQRSSDHWSFARAGLPGARLGSTPYAGYHSSGDIPQIIDREQLERTTRTMLSWLR